ncbi:DNA polymerase-3 subunit epsilon [Lipingzhangella halophila]|uniref:DNA polymerase-3 subunit epsilon n=1 Tax=Lipingzhangella halophila TaxID=1783352 RepID=A0A7W7W2Y7_9ACTN|nr:exonuclease domain-containing protein [Lipingzhangella halophila]MBB4931259.1 DNA polymerase-3 subunit epsilon [Lipingzhangella halophila]
MPDSWHQGRLAAFDIETTGLDVDTDRVVTAAVWRIDATSGATSCTEWLADPGIDIPGDASAVHGITTEYAKTHGKPAREAVTEIAAELNYLVERAVPVVVFNAAYDLTLLDRELVRYHQSADFTGGLRVVDPMVLDRQVDRFRKGSRKLGDVCGHYGIALDEQAHGCRADALAAARLAWRLAEAHEDLAAMDIDELHAAQVRWRAEQAASLQAYLRRSTSPEAVVDPNWPIIPASG